MIVRPPSLQRERTEFYSGDPAFIQLPAFAPAKANDPAPEELAAYGKLRDEHARRWELARETGDYATLLIAGQEPTAFTMRPIRGEVHRKLVDDYNTDALKPLAFAQFAFRIALYDVPGLEVKVKRNVRHVAYGEMADVDVADYFDSFDKFIVTELGQLAIQRASTIAPKS